MRNPVSLQIKDDRNSWSRDTQFLIPVPGQNKPIPGDFLVIYGKLRENTQLLRNYGNFFSYFRRLFRSPPFPQATWRPGSRLRGPIPVLFPDRARLPDCPPNSRFPDGRNFGRPWLGVGCEYKIYTEKSQNSQKSHKLLCRFGKLLVVARRARRQELALWPMPFAFLTGKVEG